MDLEQEIRHVNERLSGLAAAMESGFVGVRRDLHYMSKYSGPALLMSAGALLMSIIAITTALDNRASLLTLQLKVAAHERDLELIVPIVTQPPTPGGE